MPKQRVTVDVLTPQWQWCDLQSKKRPGKKTGERCRFCHEMKKRGQNPRYFCLLFNVELTQKGDAVEKTCLCMQNWKKNQIIDLTVEPEKADVPETEVEPKRKPDVQAIKIAVQDALKEQREYADVLYQEGLPLETADKIATREIMKRWK